MYLHHFYNYYTSLICLCNFDAGLLRKVWAQFSITRSGRTEDGHLIQPSQEGVS